MLIEINSVRKSYNSNGTAFEALKGVDLAVEEGDFVAITGESGSGKSTLLSIIGGITPPTKGDVSVDGISIYGLGSERLAPLLPEEIGGLFSHTPPSSYIF